MQLHLPQQFHMAFKDIYCSAGYQIATISSRGFKLMCTLDGMKTLLKMQAISFASAIKQKKMADQLTQ